MTAFSCTDHKPLFNNYFILAGKAYRIDPTKCSHMEITKNGEIKQESMATQILSTRTELGEAKT